MAALEAAAGKAGEETLEKLQRLQKQQQRMGPPLRNGYCDQLRRYEEHQSENML
eukprot:gene22780-29947_t